MTIGPKLDLVQFADRCIVPYLYATTRRKNEGHFVLGELAHGSAGLFDDYKDIFGVGDEQAVMAAFRILAAKPSAAARHPCHADAGSVWLSVSFAIDHRNQKHRPRKYFQLLRQAMQRKSAGSKA